jgi:isopenicillin-N epimerase
VLEQQGQLREELEREPVDFLVRRLPDLWDAARARLAGFLGADPQGLVALANATTAVNTVLRSLVLEPGDELLLTDHAYPASRNALERVAAGSRARVVVARVPFPCDSPGVVTEAVLAGVTPRTRLAMIDHVTSPTGMVLPVGEIVRALDARGVDALVDGAHAPGMLPLALDHLASAYYAGNCHKWLCAPKGAGFLHVRADRRDGVRPLVTSHGATERRAGRSPFHDEFDWMGTDDPTPFLCVPAAIEFLGSLLPGGWPEVYERNRRLALEGRAILASALGLGPPCPDEMIGSLAALPLPDGIDPLQAALREQGIEVPVIAWPQRPKRLIRISAQLYNDRSQYVRLGTVDFRGQPT